MVVECLDLNLPNTLGQVFVLELYQVSRMRGLAALTKTLTCQDSQLTQLVQNASHSSPRWTLEQLRAGKPYTARIYVSNVAGRSQPVIMKVATHKESSRFLILPPEDGKLM